MKLKQLMIGLVISSAMLSATSFAEVLQTLNQSNLSDFIFTTTTSDGSFTYQPMKPYTGNGIFVFKGSSTKATATITVTSESNPNEQCVITIKDLSASVQSPSQGYYCTIGAVNPGAATVTFKQK
jgi:hypothetical protein